MNAATQWGIIPFATNSVFEKIEIKKLLNNSGGIDYEVRGSVTYGNSCMANEFKAKRVNETAGAIYYEIFGVNKTDKICPKIYQPVTFSYLIDRRSAETETEIPEIFVNEVKVN